MLDEYSTPPFEVTFDRVSSFKHPDRRPLVLVGNNDFAGLRHFHRTLGAWLSQTGTAANDFEGRFNPHVTLLYDWREIPEQTIEPVSWTVTDFSLVLSVVGQTRYVHLKRWRLTG